MSLRTAPPAPGARVLIRDQEWMVRSTARALGDDLALKVVGLSELVKGHERIFLANLDAPTELRPEDTRLVADDTPGFRRSRLYLEALRRRTPATDDRLHVGHQGAMEVKDYQLRPAHQALSRLKPRILLADAVGLGKTVEVGVLLSELIQRGRGERILVVAVKSMLAQLQEELWSRFAIGLVRLDSVGIQRVRSHIPVGRNPFTHYNRVIVSIDTLKNDGQYRHYLEACRWDVVVIDECHNVANAGTQRWRLADLLARRSEALILTSATPHNGRPENFANLIRMLDPTAIADPSAFTKEEIEGLYLRRFKADVKDEAGESFQRRRNLKVETPASPQETRVLRSLKSLRFHTLKARRRAGGDGLFQTTLLKAFLSSPVACISTIEARDTTLKTRLETQSLSAERRAALEDDRSTLDLLKLAVEQCTPEAFGKWSELKKILEALGWDGGPKSPRIVLFSERRKTLEWLEEQLTKTFKTREGVIRQFHAGLPDVEQQAVVEAFGKGDSAVRILLASDVASEGVNLHYHCHELIHFDVPWSVITLEQRNGRIDRFGQRHTPTIRYLLTTCEAEEIQGDLRIVERLVEKAQAVEMNLGGAEAAFGLYDPDLEEDATAEAIEAGVGPESFLASDPFGGLDFEALLQEGQAEPSQEKVPTALAEGLFPDDVAFLKATFEELGEDQPDLPLPQWHPERPLCTLVAPEDLRRQCAGLPREAIPSGWELTLSAERDAVMDAIEAARAEEGVWPAIQLLWPLHPVLLWACDRVLVRFGRHEAPILKVPALGGRPAFLFEGVTSNQRSQPVLHAWFGVLLGDGAPEILPFEALMARSGFEAGLPNDGAPSPRAGDLQGRLGEAVGVARAHMTALRAERAQGLRKDLKAHTRRVNGWHAKALETITAAEASAGARRDGALTRPQREAFTRQRERIERWKQEHDDWLKEALTTEDRPYLRLVAVFDGGEGE